MHFQFHDYAKLTVIGVVIACAAWPVVARITSAPRWLFFRLAVLVTLVLFLPDLYIWHQGQPVQAVLVLMSMHVAIALVTYNLLVHVAPVRGQRRSRKPVGWRRRRRPRRTRSPESAGPSAAPRGLSAARWCRPRPGRRASDATIRRPRWPRSARAWWPRR